MKKIISLVLALVMIMALAITVSAADTGTITVTNAAMGETYKVFKLFDAKVGDNTITYQGVIPTSLTDIFEENASGNIVVKDGVTDDEVVAAVQGWAATQTATEDNTKTGDGNAVVFTVPYGYYAVTTTQGSVVSVTSTNPDAEIVDKNSGTPTLGKKVDDVDVNIGQTVTYTVDFDAYDYYGSGDKAERVTEYYITDTRAQEFLDDITVTSIVVQQDPYDKNNDSDKKETTLETQQFDSESKIVIPWATKTTTADGDTYTGLYANGSKIIITYTGVVTEDAVIDGSGNTNKVTLSWTTVKGDYPDQLEKSVTIYTYAIAVKKVDQDGNALTGATFKLPFYVTEDTDGTYIYAGTTETTGAVDQVTTKGNAVIIVKGVAQGDYTISETSAPDGYNKMPGSVTVKAVQTGKTSTSKSWWIAADGTVYDEKTEETKEVTLSISDIAAGAILVVNKPGTPLPSTGGMGTTLFYVFGAIMVMGAAVLLVTKKRMAR